MKNAIKWVVMVVGILALLGMVIGTFDWAAEPVAKVLNKPVEGVKSVARTVASVCIGIVVILAAITSIAASPVLGVVLLAVGVLTVVISLWPVFSSKTL